MISRENLSFLRDSWVENSLQHIASDVSSSHYF